MKRGQKTLISVGAIFALMILMQFIPVTRDNPPIGGDFDERQDVARILRQACYNCHSNETSWPWYSGVAPISWLIANDVSEAREHLNFSSWKSMAAGDQAHAKSEIWEEIEHGKMPPALYAFRYSEAKLSEADQSTIHSWTVGLPAKADSASATMGTAHD